MTYISPADAQIEDAQQATGLTEFDSWSFKEGLDILIADANRAGYNEAGTARMNTNLVQLLSHRLMVHDYHRQRPDLKTRPIEKPLFVCGIPRTGTTLLSNLLACDPARRSPLTWEIDDPVPPATTATLKSDPRAVERLAREKAMLEANPAMGAIYRNSAVYPNECIFFMAHDFKALMLESRGRLPNYRDWLFSTDMTSAYDYHKYFLQLLQADAPGTWNLKMPSHCLWLDTILTTYPDARIIWTHRDPFAAMGSFCSIISMGHRGFTAQPDVEWIADNCTYQMELHLNRLMDYRERHGADSLVDVHYAEVIADPLGTIRRLYAALGDDFTPEAEAAMQAWLDDNPQNKFGKHEYKLEQYGLTLEGLAPKFERYLSSNEVVREG